VSVLARLTDENGNGVLELDEFTALISDVLNRMQTQLPSQIPMKYCAEFHVAPSLLDGVEGRITEKFRSLSRSTMAKQIFDIIDEKQVGFLEPNQLSALHRLMEAHVLKDLYESIGLIMVQKQLSAFDKV
jgi:hypothetical protein